MRIIECLVKNLRDSAIFNPEVQVTPSCILWPDKDRQWEAVIPRLQSELAELLVLGDYRPEHRTGPAIWLRCVIAGKTSDITFPAGRVPVFYLPGVSRQDLRAIEDCPDRLKPLAELQYRGVIWSQASAKDWTIMAFLKSQQGGMGLDVAQDNDAKNSMQLALCRLMDEELELLKCKRLDKDYFNTLLTGGDPVRDLLQWLDLGDAFQAARGENEWTAFVEVCKSQLAFNPQTEGVLAGASKLAMREGPWHSVWERYSEAPKRYPYIPSRMRQSKPPQLGIFDAPGEKLCGWPQWNEEQEKSLQQDLLALNHLPAHAARMRVLEIEKVHASRRELVWAELGESPLALAVKHLAVVAEVTRIGLAAGSVPDMQSGYATQGWRADDAMLSALACVDKAVDVEAVTSAIRAIYLPWLEESARYLQQVISGSTYPGGRIAEAPAFYRVDGQCVLFVDGLRFDAARRLSATLEASGRQVVETMTWTALPSVTATGKAAVSPVRSKISGSDACDDFEPCVAATGQSLKGGYHLKKLLIADNWKVLDRTDNGDGRGNAWCEFGDIDSEGHVRGWKLAKHIDPLLGEIAERIAALFAAGWTSVKVVTDHGWLLMPGKLPTIPLSKDLADSKWGRCASIKTGASTNERLYPWFWNPHQQFALADGVGCYGKSVDYNHGGLSLQECLTLELTVTQGANASSKQGAEVTDIAWKGLRCTVAADGEYASLSLDIRTHAGDPTTSVVMSIKPLKDNGTASVVVENEELQGREAFLVLLNSSGELVAEANTVIGGRDE
ncbi:BREX-1 system phosphatase PglZ type B [Stenotrophomonas maltophilia]|uniref:BREX-1 system phosphatase PglZ type B n=1 Tax=Stenotrophomonas TaxID=40323 RepID=UPI0013133349|nr:BREX-1 system phosphatase PglZ type B [Stenotrophomonas sp. RAC2]MBH1702629.1 BREX-1 system phosphatase PglZ type B [Stenotrophomonas maltophilia]MDV9042554.1 BREX-1 system phosphatase PglZ type B [Stenotrophomonas sp. RAC2]